MTGPMRKTTALVGVLFVVAAMLTPGCRTREIGDLSEASAADALRAAPQFTTRSHSPVGRELVEVVAVRRIGRSSTEVEFTWRDTAAPVGETVAPLRTSMALFRLRDEGVWALASLYKVN